MQKCSGLWSARRLGTRCPYLVLHNIEIICFRNNEILLFKAIKVKSTINKVDLIFIQEHERPNAVTLFTDPIFHISSKL
jgi:hypothetical protein